MADPISSRSSTTGPRYDHEAGVCTVDPPASPASSGSSARTATAGAPADDSACWRERVLATAACATAVGGALTAATGVGVILAVSAGAACGAKLADAEAVCKGK